jgi:hypothetical protein
MKVSLHKYSPFVGVCSLYILKMHGESSIKLVNAQQGKVLNNLKNTTVKLHKNNSDMWFNICRKEQLSPTYIEIKINGNNEHCSNTKSARIRYRLVQEIKILCKKKAVLNMQLYDAYLECAAYWKNLWPIVQLCNQ